MQPHPMHEAVRHIRSSGHVPDLFKEPQDKKEDHEDRQKREDHAGTGKHAIGKKSAEPPGRRGAGGYLSVPPPQGGPERH